MRRVPAPTYRLIALAAAGWLTAAAAATAGTDAPAITDLRVTRQGDLYVGACRLVGGLDADTLEEIEAGLETTIDYRLQVYRRRDGLPDPAIVKRRVRCTVRHDALTRQYTLTRRIDGEIQETRVAPEAAAMREFLTVIDGLPLVRVDELAEDQQYYLKAKSNLGLVWRFYLIPWRLDTPWEQVEIDTTQGNGVEPRP